MITLIEAVGLLTCGEKLPELALFERLSAGAPEPPEPEPEPSPRHWGYWEAGHGRMDYEPPEVPEEFRAKAREDAEEVPRRIRASQQPPPPKPERPAVAKWNEAVRCILDTASNRHCRYQLLGLESPDYDQEASRITKVIDRHVLANRSLIASPFQNRIIDGELRNRHIKPANRHPAYWEVAVDDEAAFREQHKAELAALGRAPKRRRSAYDQIQKQALRYLANEGYPEAGDGEQAKLERHIAELLDSQRVSRSESAVRDYATRAIKEYKKQLSS